MKRSVANASAAVGRPGGIELGERVVGQPLHRPAEVVDEEVREATDEAGERDAVAVGGRVGFSTSSSSFRPGSRAHACRCSRRRSPGPAPRGSPGKGTSCRSDPRLPPTKRNCRLSKCGSVAVSVICE